MAKNSNTVDLGTGRLRVTGTIKLDDKWNDVDAANGHQKELKDEIEQKVLEHMEEVRQKLIKQIVNYLNRIWLKIIVKYYASYSPIYYVPRTGNIKNAGKKIVALDDKTYELEVSSENMSEYITPWGNTRSKSAVLDMVLDGKVSNNGWGGNGKPWTRPNQVIGITTGAPYGGSSGVPRAIIQDQFKKAEKYYKDSMLKALNAITLAKID